MVRAGLVGGMGGCPWWGLAFGLMAVSCTRGVPPPLSDGCGFFLWFQFIGVGLVGLLSKFFIK